MFDAPNARVRRTGGVGRWRSETEGVVERRGEGRREREREEGVMDGVTAAGDTLSLPLHLLWEEGTLVESALGERARVLELQLQLRNQATVVKGPPAARRPGTHSGSKPLEFKAAIVLESQVNAASAVRILDDALLLSLFHSTPHL